MKHFIFFLYFVLIVFSSFASHAQKPPSSDILQPIVRAPAQDKIAETEDWDSLLAFSEDEIFTENSVETIMEDAIKNIPLIPDAVYKEAEKFEKYCRQAPNLYTYYNCECMAANFLDERIKQGPEASRSGILQSIEGECQDAIEAAALQYETCLGNALLLPKDIDPETYCTCFGNKFAIIFQDNKVKVSPSNITRVQTQAHAECRKDILQQN